MGSVQFNLFSFLFFFSYFLLSCLVVVVFVLLTISSRSSANCLQRKYCDSWDMNWSHHLLSWQTLFIKYYPDCVYIYHSIIDGTHQRRNISTCIYIDITKGIVYNRWKKNERERKVSLVFCSFGNGIPVKCFSCCFDQANTMSVSCIYIYICFSYFSNCSNWT